MNTVEVDIIELQKLSFTKGPLVFNKRQRGERWKEKRGESQPNSSSALTTNYFFFTSFSLSVESTPIPLVSIKNKPGLSVYSVIII